MPPAARTRIIRRMLGFVSIGRNSVGYFFSAFFCKSGVRMRLCSIQSIHTELAKLYSQKVISCTVCTADLWGGKFDPPGPNRESRRHLSRQRSGVVPKEK